MRPTKLSGFAALAASLLFSISGFSQSSPVLPRLEKRGEATQLIVDNKPYLILGGELRNSNTSNLEYLQPLLPKLAKMNMNTVLAPVTWDLMEPEEGKFDFTLVDGLLKQARESKLRVVVLWFGTWKNGLSHYVPDWVKKDFRRFPRVKLASGKSTETVSVFSKEALSADTKAFTALMKHLKVADAAYRTVIMVQVENEVGIHGDTRDRSTIANTAFSQPAPAELIAGLKKYQTELQPAVKNLWEAVGSKTNGSWEDIFSKNLVTDEIFMAWNYAKYINQVAAAGKAQYDLPMYVNAWLPQNHPKGGPVASMHDIWRVGAPQIDFFAPDIYKAEFKQVVANYYHTWKPLFIPESVADSAGASNAYYVIGKYKALGFSPFAVEDRITGYDEPIPVAYKELSDMAPVILEAQRKSTITAVTVNNGNPVDTIEMGGYRLEVRPRITRGKTPAASSGYGLIINSGPDEFILSGLNFEVSFTPATPGPQMAGLASVWEGTFKNGEWVPGRKLNGDEVMVGYDLAKQAANNKTGTVARIQNNAIGTLKVKLYRFE
ncbi:MAG: hypothetical protein K0S09_706 [Sphingobacteriaceae bacterium]|jgi:hypothetical protein|nr:hypothetical protein [Sphingobacteriaceae bacterium]